MKRYRRAALGGVLLAALAACGGGSEKHKTTGPEVVVRNISFKPSTMTVKAGGEVTWTFEDKNIAHNVVAEDGSFKSETLSKGTFIHKFAAPGTVRYTCTVHPAQMKGNVEVRA